MVTLIFLFITQVKKETLVTSDLLVPVENLVRQFINHGAGAMVQRWRALAVPLEDLGLVPSNHIAAHGSL